MCIRDRSNPIKFQTSGSEKARFDTSGRLLIATTSSTGDGNADDLQIGAPTDSTQRGITIGSSAAGSIRFADDGNTTAGYIFYSHSDNSLRFGSNGAEAARLDSGGDMGLGTTSPSARLEAVSNTTPQFKVGMANDADRASLMHNGSDLYLDTTAGGLIFRGASNAERMRIDSSGRLMIGTTAQASAPINQQLAVASTDGVGISNLRFGNNGSPPYLQLGKSRGTSINSYTSVSSGDEVGRILFVAADGTDMQCQPASIGCFIDGTPGSDDMPGRLVFKTAADGAATPTERMRIDSSGIVLTGTTSTTVAALSSAGVGHRVSPSGIILQVASNAQRAADFNRTASDGEIVGFRQAGTLEGTINVSGSSVTLVGGHLSRWSQLAGGAERIEILRGSVLSNLDEMCEWGEEDNEQLNRMQVSDVEGDVNVSGVFMAWDDDDETYLNDFYCAMTGDFVIRIAQGTTVARGDLLMSAGDGTAKPQDDDIVRSKTIAKVTSTTVSTTYADGSYCVPCVLMAC